MRTASESGILGLWEGRTADRGDVDVPVWYHGFMVCIVPGVPIQTWYELYYQGPVPSLPRSLVPYKYIYIIQLGPPLIWLLGLLRLALISLQTPRVVSSPVIQVFFIIPEWNWY